MKTNLKFIGIDVSKYTLDICILWQGQFKSYVIANREKAIVNFFEKHLAANFQYHICIENTGKYCWSLMRLLPEMPCYFYMLHPLHLNKSLGLIRGVDDKTAAIRIAEFIKKNYDRLSTYIPRRKQVETLQLLLAERQYKVKQRGQLKAKNKEFGVLDANELLKGLINKNQELIAQLSAQIKALEMQIKQLIKEEPRLERLDRQLRSIPGVGPILSWHILVKTNEFKSICDPRKLACYAGVAPFSKKSGISVAGKSRVSHFADKTLKKLLHLAAMSAIRLENDLRVFYQRKVEQGKNKMSVLNAVRNKIIHIIFALVKNQTFYQNRLVVS